MSHEFLTPTTANYDPFGVLKDSLSERSLAAINLLLILAQEESAFASLNRPDSNPEESEKGLEKSPEEAFVEVINSAISTAKAGIVATNKSLNQLDHIIKQCQDMIDNRQITNPNCAARRVIKNLHESMESSQSKKQRYIEFREDLEAAIIELEQLLAATQLPEHSPTTTK